MSNIHDDLSALEKLTHHTALKAGEAHKLASSAVQPHQLEQHVEQHLETRLSRAVSGHKEKLAADLESLKGVQREEHTKAMKPHKDEVAALRRLVQSLVKRVAVLEAHLNSKGVVAKATGQKRKGDVFEGINRRVEAAKRHPRNLRDRADKAISDPRAYEVVSSHLQAGEIDKAELIVKAYEARVKQ